ncbi:MAG: hypothetical protein CBC48_11585 [bacterium TMED88]|nr:hypothetical protein [Deltaproteobacteria bacterium]OUV29680.1 MAG: hypothetical protein CBC48_11585 [bacterium TMED88]
MSKDFELALDSTLLRSFFDLRGASRFNPAPSRSLSKPRTHALEPLHLASRSTSLSSVFARVLETFIWHSHGAHWMAPPARTYPYAPRGYSVRGAEGGGLAFSLGWSENGNPRRARGLPHWIIRSSGHVTRRFVRKVRGAQATGRNGLKHQANPLYLLRLAFVKKKSVFPGGTQPDESERPF